jgi:hypothetical protein
MSILLRYSGEKSFQRKLLLYSRLSSSSSAILDHQLSTIYESGLLASDEWWLPSQALLHGFRLISFLCFDSMMVAIV